MTVALIAGVGCRASASAGEVIDLIKACLLLIEASSGIAELATLDRNTSHPAILAAAAHFNARIVGLDDIALARQPAPNPSEKVEKIIGLASVAEAAVLARGTLLVPKHASANATCALGALP